MTGRRWEPPTWPAELLIVAFDLPEGQEEDLTRSFALIEIEPSTTTSQGCPPPNTASNGSRVDHLGDVWGDAPIDVKRPGRVSLRCSA